MTFTRIASGGAVEVQATVVAGRLVHVFPGTVEQGGPVQAAPARAWATFTDVVLPGRADSEPGWPILRAAFGANPPAAPMVTCGPIDRA